MSDVKLEMARLKVDVYLECVKDRPVLWECGATNIVMKFDRMGRRVEYVETVNGATNAHHRFVYDGYLCIQRLNAAANNAIDLVFGWDPSESIATRPLILQKYGQYNLFYTHDGNKNVSELVFFQQANGIAAHYEYAPFGTVTATSRSTPVTAYDFCAYNPFRFSSEYADDALELVYYNFRHYEQCVGRWLNRDPIEEDAGENVYCFVENSPSWIVDFGGLHSFQFNDKGWSSGNVSQNNGGVLGVTSFSIKSDSRCKCVSGKYSPEYTFIIDIYSMVQDADDSKWEDDEYGDTIRDPRIKSKWNSFWFFESRRRRNLAIEHEERHRQHARKNYDAVIGALREIEEYSSKSVCEANAREKIAAAVRLFNLMDNADAEKVERGEL